MTARILNGQDGYGGQTVHGFSGSQSHTVTRPK